MSRLRLPVLIAGALIPSIPLVAAPPPSAGLHAPPSHRPGDGSPRGAAPVFFKPMPLVITVADLGPQFDSASITDIEAADFDRDGRTDLAVAWYATDSQDSTASIRALTLFYGTGSTELQRAADISLYVRNPNIESLSIFRHGTAELAVGDFDGDGDLDLAATPFFGDEIWFIENAAPRQFIPRVKYMFGINSPGNAVTPTEATAADFDQDGRDDVVYVADPIQRIAGLTIHFWRTNGPMTGMSRVSWEGINEGYTNWTRGLAVADFDGDSRPDLCFSATTDPVEELGPTLVFWHNLNVATRRFEVTAITPSFISSDVAAFAAPEACAPGVVLSDADGTQLEVWSPLCQPIMEFDLTAGVSGFPGCVLNRGMAVVVADLNADGHPDIVTRQKVGDLDCPHIDLVLGRDGLDPWVFLTPAPVDASGFRDPADNEILRPRNLAVADLFGSRRPEIIAGFGPTPRGPTGLGALEIAIWAGCLGDVDDNGQTDLADLTLLLTAMGCDGGPQLALVDLDRDGCVGLSDLTLLLADFGCIAGGG